MNKAWKKGKFKRDWRCYRESELLSFRGIEVLLEIAEKHGQTLKIFRKGENNLVVNQTNETLAIYLGKERLLILTRDFESLVNKEPWRKIFKEFEKKIQPYARAREEIGDIKNRKKPLPKEKFLPVIKQILHEKREFVWYKSWNELKQPSKARGFQGNIWGWEIIFLDFQEEDKISAHRFFIDADGYLNTLGMRVLPENEVAKNYLCFILKGEIKRKNYPEERYKVKAHLVIDLRPSSTEEIFFEAEAKLTPSPGMRGANYLQKLWISGRARKPKSFPEIFENVLRKILTHLGLSRIKIEHQGTSFLGKCKIVKQSNR